MAANLGHSFVGLEVGILVGLDVGANVGTAVGLLVGLLVGATVGRFVGGAVGKRVGPFEGFLVGRAGIMTVVVGFLVVGFAVVVAVTQPFAIMFFMWWQPFLCLGRAAAWSAAAASTGWGEEEEASTVIVKAARKAVPVEKEAIFIPGGGWMSSKGVSRRAKRVQAQKKNCEVVFCLFL